MARVHVTTGPEARRIAGWERLSAGLINSVILVIDVVTAGCRHVTPLDRGLLLSTRSTRERCTAVRSSSVPRPCVEIDRRETPQV